MEGKLPAASCDPALAANWVPFISGSCEVALNNCFLGTFVPLAVNVTKVTNK